MCWAEGLFTGGVNAAAAALTQLLSTEPFSVAESSMVIILLFTLSLLLSLISAFDLRVISCY